MLGPTAAGKSVVAEAIADAMGGEIVSVDSMQVYRRMDIGTAKPTAQVRLRIPHHLIDLVDPEEEFTAAQFQAAGRTALEAIAGRGGVAVVSGGSGLHFRALVDPLTFPPTDEAVRTELESTDPETLLAELLGADPGAARLVDVDNPRRVLRAVEILRLTGETPTARAGRPEAGAVRGYRSLVPFRAVGLDPGEALGRRIEERFDRMLDAGLLAEVASLADRLGRTAAQAVGYKQLLPVVAGRTSLAEARTAAIGASGALAKRQRTFFGRDRRIEWLPWQDDLAAMAQAAMDHLEGSALWSS